MPEETWVSKVLFKLFVLGFFLMCVGVLFLIAAAVLQGDTSVSAGLIVFIGPIPIVLGAGPHASLALLLAVILTIVGFIVFFWLRRTRAWVWSLWARFPPCPISCRESLTLK